MNNSSSVFLILIFCSFLTCAPKYYERENECIKGSRSLENSEFTSNLILARNGIINATKTFKIKNQSTEEEAEIRKDYESLRVQINNMLVNLKEKLSQQEQRQKILSDTEYLDETIGNQLDAVRKFYDNHYRHKINKMIRSEYAALGLQEVGMLITIGNELYKAIARYIEKRNAAITQQYQSCFETYYIANKRMPVWEDL
jgi:hypothetical protein